MAKLVYGERIGREGTIMVGCSAVLFNESREKILLTRRSDNGRWCLPGGQMERGESLSETCIREVEEETGLRVQITNLIGVYSTPHRLLEYADGNRHQLVSCSFEVELLDGTLTLSNETTEFGYFSAAEMRSMDIMDHHIERIADAFQSQAAAYIR
jgi:ADP-ribose pyrophosphatase YjhB (NUDIX family)